MTIKNDLLCQRCNQSVERDELKCPNCGEPLRGTDMSETISQAMHFDIPPLLDHMQRRAVSLQPREIALYIEDASIPLIIDLSNRATLGRHSAKDTRVSPTVSLNSYDAFNRGISRVHATLYYDDDRATAMLVDEYSTNGTWINGQRVAPMTPTPLQNGDEIRLSRLRILMVTPSS